MDPSSRSKSQAKDAKAMIAEIKNNKKELYSTDGMKLQVEAWFVSLIIVLKKL